MIGTLLESPGLYFDVPEEELEAYALIPAMGPTCLWFQPYELEKSAGSFGLPRGGPPIRSGRWRKAR